MWYLELSRDYSECEYEVIFNGLFKTKSEAEKAAEGYRYHVKILKFVEVY